MGQEIACCGSDDPVHTQVNTEIARRTTEANVEQIQEELDNAKNENKQINTKYQNLYKQYQTEKEEKSKLMNQVQVVYILHIATIQRKQHCFIYT